MHSISDIAIRGVTAAVPQQTLRSEDYELLTPEERQRFIKVTGIEERHVATAEQCASDLCAFAVDDLLAGIGWKKEEIGLMVLVSQSPDYPVPATSIIMQDRLGLPRHCICFDVNLGCSAYPYGLAIAGSMMKSLGITRGLLVVGDVSSKACAYTDKSSWPLFSDAGSATALEILPGHPPMHFDLANDGSGYKAIIVPSGMNSSRAPITAALLEPVEVGDGIKRNATQLVLEGADIFNFAIKEAPASIIGTLSKHETAIDNIDYVVLHQANKLINDTIRVKIGAKRDQMLSTLKEYGNSSSVSIPLTMAVHGDKLRQAPHLALSGFGVGLSWGTALVKLPADAFFSLRQTNDVYPA